MKSYKRINNEFKQAINASLTENQGQKKLIQIKNFLDNSITDVVTNEFPNQDEKIKHLLNTLLNLRDYLTSENTENSLKVSLLNVYNQIEQKVFEEEEHLKKTKEESTTLTSIDQSELNQSTWLNIEMVRILQNNLI